MFMQLICNIFIIGMYLVISSYSQKSSLAFCLSLYQCANKFPSIYSFLITFTHLKVPAEICFLTNILKLVELI